MNENKKNPEHIFESLRNDLQLFENEKNGTGIINWILFDPVADKYYKIGQKEHTILSFFSKPAPVSTLLEKIQKTDNTVTAHDLNSVITFLHSNNLLQASLLITENRINQIKKAKEKARLKMFFQSYLFFRIPLWNPDNFLTKTQDIVKALFNKPLMMILGFISACGYILLIINWNKFETTIIDSLNYAGLVKYSITVIFLKVIHELAHAYTAKTAGIRVRRFGIGFIVFFPRFFTDITDSWRLNNRKKKVLIDAAGILSECLIGGIAVIFWVYSSPGIVNTIAYYVFAVSIINTALVNGNPFIRYDGYYILMDILNIDNLQQRSRILISTAFREKFFGLKQNIPFKEKNWEKKLIVVFGISSFIYRIFLYTGIILIVYYKFIKVVGIVLAIIEVYFLIVMPISRELKIIMKSIKKADKKKVLITLTGLIILLIIFFIPLPWTVSLPCIIGSSEDNILYIQTPGFLKNLTSQNEMYVKKGQTLFELDNPFLKYDNSIMQEKLKIKETELDQIKSITEKRFQESHNTKIQQVEQIKSAIKENERKLSLLTIKSPIDGIFVLFDWKMKPGKWLDYGIPIGEVFSENDLVVYAYAEEKYADYLKLSDNVVFYLEDNISKFKGEVIRISKVPTKEWHPSPLLDVSGGNLPVLKKESTETYVLKNYYYQITIRPDKFYNNLQFSRTGDVQIRRYSSIGLNFLRATLSAIIRELSF